MNAAGRLSAYAAGLVVTFGAAFGIAGAVVPEDAAAAWRETSAEEHGSGSKAEPERVRGLGLAQDGFVLSPVMAPTQAGVDGELSFRVLGEDDEPVTEFATAHEKDLHLIVVRSDGAQFRHVHPELDLTTGTWSVPWTWQDAGTYRLFADFVPVHDEDANITLTRTVEVGGQVTPVAAHNTMTTHEVGGFEATITGDLVAGSTSELTVTITRDGEPVTTLEPYLGAFGHLVALRQGDLGYLHVHAEGAEPRPGDVAGPAITFATEAPTAGRYLLYLDFQVDGEVHTAAFLLDAGAGNDGIDEQMDSGEH